MKYEESDLVGLTDEERAALLEDEEQEGTEAVEEEGQEEAAEGNDDGQEGDDAGGQADHEDGEEGEGEPAGDEAEADAGGSQARQSAPILVADSPENAQERLLEIADEKKNLRKQYDDGDLTFEDYESKVEALDDERLELKLALNTAETAAKIAHQQEVNRREESINSFLANVGIPRDEKDARYQHLNNAVIAIANLPDSRNKEAHEILSEAYDLCVFRGQLPARDGKGRQAEPAPSAKPAAKASAPRKPAPPTLANVPAADMTDATAGSRFAYLDRMDPVAREAAFAKLSPADQDAYLQQA